jgi:hypothetical protein
MLANLWTMSKQDFVLKKVILVQRVYNKWLFGGSSGKHIRVEFLARQGSTIHLHYPVERNKRGRNDSLTTTILPLFDIKRKYLHTCAAALS